MTNNNEFTTRLYAAFGAVAMTLTLFASYFATPTATTIAGVIA